jgi:hypothetical protein
LTDEKKRCVGKVRRKNSIGNTRCHEGVYWNLKVVFWGSHVERDNHQEMQAIRWGDLTERENSSGDGRKSPGHNRAARIKIITNEDWERT